MKPTLEVLYEDNHLLAVNKPAGLLTQDSGTGHENLEDRARAYIKETRNKPGTVFLHAIHRLDRPVSGIVLFACTSKALSRLNQQIREHKDAKRYLALTAQPPPEPSGTLEHFLAHRSHSAELCSADAAGAKRAKLEYEILEKTHQGWLWEIRLITGRYHQIRAQLSALGCPILGDKRYGSTATWNPNSIALHHAELTILHPTQKNERGGPVPCSIKAPGFP